MRSFKVIVDKSTVPVGSADKVRAAINAEFMRRFATPDVPHPGELEMQSHTMAGARAGLTWPIKTVPRQGVRTAPVGPAALIRSWIRSGLVSLAWAIGLACH